VKTLIDTLMERVEKLLPPSRPPLEWGNPRLSTTPTSIAIGELARRMEALEEAVREIALEVQKASDHVQQASDQGLSRAGDAPPA
jgi:hypothetical protein